MSRFLCVLLCAAGFSVPSLAQDEIEVPEAIVHVEGVVEPLEVAFPLAPDGQEESADDGIAVGHVLWSQSFLRTGSGSVQLRLENRGTAPDASGGIEILDGNGTVIERIDATRLSSEGVIWTDLAFGPFIEILVVGDAGTGLSFAITAISLEKTGARVESIIGPDERQQIVDYSGTFSRILPSVEGAVAKLSFIKTENGFPKRFVCTGFLIADDLFLTNEHCVSTPDICATAKVLFGFEINQFGTARPREQVRCTAVEKVSVPLDYALLRLAGNPGQRWGKLTFADHAPQAGEKIFIVQHPAGEPKQISDTDCMVAGVPVLGLEQNTDLSHSCDTLGGSSGSPVFNAEGEVVGLHHLGKQSSGQFAELNRAVLSTKILAELSD